MLDQEKIVYHVVLLIPDEVAQMAIEASQQLIVANGVDRFKLDLVNRPPHITLGLGVIDRENINNLTGDVGDLSKKYKDIFLTLSSIDEHGMKSIVVEKKKQLQNLHKDVMFLLNKYNEEQATQDYFVNSVAEEFLVNYVSNFNSSYTRENYYPHITIGSGAKPKAFSLEFPISFQPNFLAVGQMGNMGSFLKEFKRFKL